MAKKVQASIQLPVLVTFGRLDEAKATLEGLWAMAKWNPVIANEEVWVVMSKSTGGPMFFWWARALVPLSPFLFTSSPVLTGDRGVSTHPDTGAKRRPPVHRRTGAIITSTHRADRLLFFFFLPFLPHADVSRMLSMSI